MRRNKMIKIKIQIILDKAGEPEETLLACGTTIGELKKRLNPQMEYLFIINGTNKLDNYVLLDGDNVKILPLMSGG